MKQPDERTIIETHFKEQWGDETPVQFENIPFERPSGAPYASLWVLPEDGRQTSPGKEPVWRFDGRIEAVVNVLVAHKDEQREGTLVKKIEGIFRNVLLDGIHVRDDVEVAAKEINGWRRTRLVFRIRWEEHNGQRVKVKP